MDTPLNEPEVAVLPQTHRGDSISLGGLSLTQVRPIRDRVLVKRIEPPQGLIVLTDREKPRVCQIVSLGPKATWGYEIGQTVLVSPSINMDYPDLVEDDEQYVLIQQADILGVWEA